MTIKSLGVQPDSPTDLHYDFDQAVSLLGPLCLLHKIITMPMLITIAFITPSNPIKETVIIPSGPMRKLRHGAYSPSPERR